MTETEGFMKAQIEQLEKENKSLKEELKEVGETLYHRDSVLSVMYDLVRADMTMEDAFFMIRAVIDDECGNYNQLSKGERELVKRFWERDFI